MSGITSDVGLFSGINTKQLIDQLIAVESRPKQLAQKRVLQLQAQQAAYLDINSNLLNLRTAAAAFNTLGVFKASKASSSNTSVLTATAGNNAATGNFSISVSRLVSTHQVISRGFDNKDSSGVGATSFSFEVGGGRVDADTALAELNGGTGVQRGKIKVTDSSGQAAVIDLSKAVTVNDVLDAINGAAGVDVVASVSGDRLRVTDGAAAGGTLQIEDVFGSATASSLKLVGTAASGGSITSSASLLYVSNETPLSLLNDGNGVSFGAGGANAAADFQIKLTDGGTPSNSQTYNIVLGDVGTGSGSGFVVDSPAVATVGDLIARINSQTSGAVAASISADGRGITLTDTTGDTNRALSVVAGTSHSAVQDLGLLQTAAGSQGSQTITGKRLLAGINSTLAANLNGGAGVSAGTFNVTRRNGTNFDVTIGANATVADIIDAINTAGGGTVTARVNDTGNGIRVADSTTGGSLVIADTSGTAAAALKIATTGAANGIIDSGNLQTRYVSGARRVGDLNAGKGIGIGEFKITDSLGASAIVNLTSSTKTVDDLIKLLNDKAPQVRINARINDNGDGILLEDTGGGTGKLKVEDTSGTVAKSLNLAGESTSATVGSNKIDGSYERTVTFSATDTLQKVVDKINSTGVGVSASIVNSGSAVNPYKIIFTSRTSGEVGRFIVDPKGFDLGGAQLAKGRDAVAFFGSGDAAQSVLLTSSTNTLDGVVQGVTIDLLGVSDTPVQVTVSRDTGAVEETINKFVDAFNQVLGRLDFHDRYNVDTGERGALLGESTVGTVRNALLAQVQGTPTGVTGQFSRLFQVGVSVGSGAQLQFDRDRFRAALQADPQGVADLFTAFDQSPAAPQVLATDAAGNPLITTPSTNRTYTKLGVAEQIKLLATSFTNSVDGLLTQRKKTLDTQIDFQNQRIADFDVQLGNKRSQLEQQFAALEQSLAALQTQQAALGSLGARAG